MYIFYGKAGERERSHDLGELGDGFRVGDDSLLGGGAVDFRHEGHPNSAPWEFPVGQEIEHRVDPHEDILRYRERHVAYKDSDFHDQLTTAKMSPWLIVHEKQQSICSPSSRQIARKRG